MSAGGKGSAPRPFSVDQQTFANNWDTIFSKKNRVESKTCTCGRSPTGNCIGWHNLSEDDYNDRLNAYELELYKKSAQDLWTDSCTSFRSEE